MLLASQLLQVLSAVISLGPWVELVQWEKLLAGLAVSGVVLGYCDTPFIYTNDSGGP